MPANTGTLGSLAENRAFADGRGKKDDGLTLPQRYKFCKNKRKVKNFSYLCIQAIKWEIKRYGNYSIGCAGREPADAD